MLYHLGVSCKYWESNPFNPFLIITILFKYFALMHRLIRIGRVLYDSPATWKFRVERDFLHQKWIFYRQLFINDHAVLHIFYLSLASSRLNR